ncbi:MAG: DUF3572 domain-containing protein [Erythrobacter sp.]
MSAIGSSDPARPEAAVLSLAALGWLLEDDDRAQRFLSLTGLDPDTLRAAIGETQTQVAVLEFLAAHEPDLISAAEALAVTPEELIAAMHELKR